MPRTPSSRTHSSLLGELRKRRQQHMWYKAQGFMVGRLTTGFVSISKAHAVYVLRIRGEVRVADTIAVIFSRSGGAEFFESIPGNSHWHQILDQPLLQDPEEALIHATKLVLDRCPLLSFLASR